MHHYLFIKPLLFIKDITRFSRNFKYWDIIILLLGKKGLTCFTILFTPELPDVQAGLRKGREARDQIANIHWIIEKAREFKKKNCFIDYAKSTPVCVDRNKLWKILKEMRLPDHLTCLLRNLYADQEATVRTGRGTTDWFQIGKEVHQGCILSPCLFHLYAEYIMWNAGLDEVQAGIKITGRNINNLRYVNDTTLMAESKEELKSLLMKVKEESEKAEP